MIVSKETAHRIWTAHREIEVAQKLLADIREEAGRGEPETPFDRDTRKHYQLGVPTSTSGHRLFFVGPELAAQMIEAHIAAMQADLKAASIDALRELEHRP